MSASSRPLIKEHLIERPKLLAALDGALARRLTLISAQAGAGKTTLLRQWEANHADRSFTHLDIESGDDDPAHFMRRLIAALAPTRPAVAGASAALAGSGLGLGPELIASVTAALSQSPETVILLDDVHRFTNVTLVADLGKLIERMPRTAHVVIASRVDPPIALSRYRLNDDLVELRPAHLAFSERESAEFLTHIAGRPLDARQIHVLCERTEGWAAGLQLAGLRLRNESDADAFVNDFSGSDRLVADYLGEEVIADLPPERRQLLLEMSVLDDMCAGLVEAAVGTNNAQQILDDLERDCMFLIPLDPRRQWFRFHHLFSELLRSRLRAEDPAAELQILTAAADWHLSRSRVKSALDYLLRAQARDGAMEAMLSSAADDPTRLRGRRPPIQGLLRSAQMNEELFAGVRHAWGDESAAVPADVTRRSVDSYAAPPHRGWGFVAAQVLWRARPEISIEEARRQVERIRAGTSVVGCPTAELTAALVSGGRASFLAGHADEARRWLSEALAAAGSDVVGRVSAVSALSLVEAWTGNTGLADGLMREALESARDAGMLAHPAIADAYLASVLTSLDPQPQTENPLAEEAVPPRGPSGPTTATTSTVARRDTHHPLIAQRATEALDEEINGRDSYRIVPTILFERAAASISLGDTDPAREAVARWTDLVPVSTPLSMAQCHLLRARLAAVDDMPDEAIRELTEALQIAEMHGFVEIFVQAGPLILQRLSMITGPQAVFSDVIRAHARPEAVRSPVELAEPLTEREGEILAYLPTRFTNVELARRFFVSVNTIKTHMAHIYRKLGATNRDSAIERARELGLL